ncbi:MAG: tetratricopeptide repeat protein [Bacteroidales bacterium]|nr:tetratricopeptide repeat protein [Bacteroidales bacterium]
MEYAPTLLDSVTEKRMAEMSRIIGESYYKLNKYGEAIPYLEKYMEKAQAPSQDDKYELAYSYYKTGDYQNAIKYFERISSADNAVAQNALYHLGDCYIRLKDKNKARLAFSSASKMNYNEDMKESALFNYAIVTYELSYSPFNEAVRAFEEYIAAFPNSKRSDEAYNYLALAYSSTRNYKAALESIEKIRQKDNTIKKAHQRIAFFRGLEVYNNLRFEESIDLFDKSLQNAQYDRILAARANYWKGEAYYRLGDYAAAIDHYNKFLNSSGAPTLEEFEAANYNIAYCYFNQKQYNEAMTWFKRYASVMKDARVSTVGDSYNRIGDCYLMSSTYWTAAENYEKAINMGVSGVDYALFQKGFTLGLVNRHERKIETLNQLLKSYPASGYTDDAIYEMGRSYVTMEKPDLAISTYNRLLKDYPKSSYAPKALLQLGLINYNRDKDADAINYYKKVIADYPGSNDARDALAGLKNVYSSTNDAQSYFSYVETLGSFANVRTSEQDSMLYRAAENLYMSGNCEKASENFNIYLNKFPQGSFVTNAHFYLADCSRMKNKPDEALKGYEYVLEQPRSMFTEQALANAAEIYYADEDYQSALNTYKRLVQEGEINSNITDARLGIMRCNFKLNDYVGTIYAGAELLKTEKLPTELQREVRYMLGKSHYETDNKVAALDEFKTLAKDVKSAEGAEAKYLVADILYQQGKKDAAEKEVLDFIEKNTPHQFWLGKSFILLSDIYVDKKDEFQAYQTLKSIVDYYEVPDDGILAMAKEKQSQIKASNPNVENIGQQPDLEIDMNKKQIK